MTHLLPSPCSLRTGVQGGNTCDWLTQSRTPAWRTTWAKEQKNVSATCATWRNSDERLTLGGQCNTVVSVTHFQSPTKSQQVDQKKGNSITQISRDWWRKPQKVILHFVLLMSFLIKGDFLLNCFILCADVIWQHFSLNALQAFLKRTNVFHP